MCITGPLPAEKPFLAMDLAFDESVNSFVDSGGNLGWVVLPMVTGVDKSAVTQKLSTGYAHCG
jgi:hypothetical protein